VLLPCAAVLTKPAATVSCAVMVSILGAVPSCWLHQSRHEPCGVCRTVLRKRRASTLGDGFNRLSNPIHPKDLAARQAARHLLPRFKASAKQSVVLESANAASIFRYFQADT
jgi:hypothetical protein